MVRAFISGVIAAGVLAGLVGLAIVEFGLFDVRASTPHSAPVAWATHTTMIHAAQNGAKDTQPPPIMPAGVAAGFALYDADCASCHGGPGRARAQWVDGMNPSPPFLVDAPRHWSQAELFWIVKNGVKMTGMPSWGAVHSDAQVWDIVAFIEAMPYLGPADYTHMRAARR
jgi:mono/diheme cytochrome c family protein